MGLAAGLHQAWHAHVDQNSLKLPSRMTIRSQTVVLNMEPLQETRTCAFPCAVYAGILKQLKLQFPPDSLRLILSVPPKVEEHRVELPVNLKAADLQTKRCTKRIAAKCLSLGVCGQRHDSIDSPFMEGSEGSRS